MISTSIKDGDNSMLMNYVFDMHYRSLYYFAKNIIKEQQEAEDIVAMSFMNLNS